MKNLFWIPTLFLVAVGLSISLTGYAQQTTNDLQRPISPESFFEITNLKLARAIFKSYRQNESLIAIPVGEDQQGNVDLNGNGSSDDDILFFHANDSNTSIKTSFPLAFIGNSVQVDKFGSSFFLVDESSPGVGDLNGDFDTHDRILHINGTSTGLDCKELKVDFETGNIAFLVNEARQGDKDLNGDGDSSDEVLYVRNGFLGTITNLQLPLSDKAVFATEGNFDIKGHLVACTTPEFAQNSVDLNNDGDTNDFVVHVYDFNTDTVTNVGLESGVKRITEKNVAFSVSELFQGSTDLNGDGDVLDTILHVYNIETGITINTGLDLGFDAFFDIHSDTIACFIDEDTIDLNGDGDTSDNRVLHLYDLLTNQTTNLGLAGKNVDSGPLVFDNGKLSFFVSESNQGNVDLNGDGDTSDEVLHLTNISQASTINLKETPAFVFDVKKDTAIIGMNENDAGSDLNGDGDTTDFTVLKIRDLTSGKTIDLGLSIVGSTTRFDGDTLVFSVSEAGQGFTDLNGDNDTDDLVLFVYDVKNKFLFNSGLATGSPGSIGGNLSNLNGSLISFDVSESHQGNQDLNGDGDTNDIVIHKITPKDLVVRK